MDYGVLKKNYIGLDLIRVFSALVICMFHTAIHLGCNYGPLQGVARMGAVFMTAFFMLSGFSLFVNWGGIKLKSISACSTFWKKRFLGVVPMYWVVGFIYIILMIIMGKETVFKTVLLAPIEIIGIQSVNSSLFEVSHNGGTWFISCILLCYIVYPFFQEIIKEISKKSRMILLLICVFVLLYSAFLVNAFKYDSIYSNPFFRIIEFIIGMLLAAMKLDYKENTFVKKYLYHWWTVILTSAIMILAVSFLVVKDIEIGDYMLYNLICLPCFMIILFSLSGVESRVLGKSKALKWMASISYVFFLAQLFSNEISIEIISAADIESNLLKILIGWTMCCFIAVGFRFVEKRLVGYLQFKFLRRNRE